MAHGSDWIGIGVKGGGTLFVVGAELLEGGLLRLDPPNETHSFQVFSVRLGLGLGGGAGLAVLLVFNCDNLWKLNDTDLNDWGVNLSLGGKWDSLVKGLKNIKFFETVIKAGSKFKNLTPKDMETFRNAMHMFYNSYDIGTTSPGATKVIAIDVPGAGVGLEISVNYTMGKIEILS